MAQYTSTQLNLIKMVREKTGATFLEIIRFLENNNWNVELAFIELRERAR